MDKTYKEIMEYMMERAADLSTDLNEARVSGVNSAGFNYELGAFDEVNSIIQWLVNDHDE